MNTIRPILAATLTGLLVVPNLAHAEDIDIYTAQSSGGDANVLIVLDNESNWAATMDSNPPADADSYANCGGNTRLVLLCAEIRADQAVAEDRTRAPAAISSDPMSASA